MMWFVTLQLTSVIKNDNNLVGNSNLYCHRNPYNQILVSFLSYQALKLIVPT